MGTVLKSTSFKMADEIVEKLESTTLDDLELKKKKKKDKKEKKKEAGDGEEVVEKKEKKKKDKKKVDDALPEFSLGDKKKKPKKEKSKKSSKDDDDEGGDDTAAVGELDLGKKKKDKKKVKKEDRPVSTKASVWGNMEQLDETQMANHTYDNLLLRVFDRMEQQGVGKGSKGTKRIVSSRRRWSGSEPRNLDIKTLDRPVTISTEAQSTLCSIFYTKPVLQEIWTSLSS